MNPRENHLGLKKKGYRFHFQELENPLACRMNPLRISKPRRCLYFIQADFRVMKPRENHLGLEEEGLQVPLPCAGESLLLQYEPFPGTQPRKIASIPYGQTPVSMPQNRNNLIQKVQRVELKNPLQELPRITVEDSFPNLKSPCSKPRQCFKENSLCPVYNSSKLEYPVLDPGA